MYKKEKSLRHVAMVAKFLDDNKPKTTFKRWIRTVSNFIDLIQFPSICQMLAKFSGSEKTVSKLRKRTFLCCVRSVHKAGAWNLQKTGQAYPQDSINKLIIWKMNRLVVPVTGVKSACVMSSVYFTRTSLYLVRLKIFEWIKFLRRHLHQIQENGAGRNFITASRVNSRLITHARVQRSIWNLQLATDSTFE